MAKSKNRSRSPPPTFVLPGQGGPIQEPNKNDVLCGRGGRINSHEGNVQFRDIVSGLKHTYLAKTTKKLDKAHIAAEIVNRIRSMDPPGRFLKESPDTGLWLDIGDERARKKAGQALREDAPEIRNELDGDAKDDDDDDDADATSTGDSKVEAMSTEGGNKEEKAPAADGKVPSSSDSQSASSKPHKKKSSSDGAAAAAAAVAAVAAKVSGSKEAAAEESKKPPPTTNLAQTAAQPSRHTPSPRPAGGSSGVETPVAMNTSSSKESVPSGNMPNAGMPPPLPVPMPPMPPSATPSAMPMMPVPPHPGAQPPPFPPGVTPMGHPGYPHSGVPGYPSPHGPSATPVPMMAGTPPPVGYPPHQQPMFPSPMVNGASPPPHMAPSPPPHIPPQQQPQEQQQQMPQQQQQQQQTTLQQQQSAPQGAHHPMASPPTGHFGDPPSLHSSMTSVGVPSTVPANMRSSVASSVTFNTTSTAGHSSMPSMQQQMQQYHFNANNGGTSFGHGMANGFGNQHDMQQHFNMMQQQQQQVMGRPQHLNDEDDEESEPTAEDFAALMGGGNGDMDQSKFRDEDMFSAVSSRRRHKKNGERFSSPKGGGLSSRGRLGGASAATPDEVPSARATIDLTADDDDDDEQEEREANQLEAIARLGQQNFGGDDSTRKYAMGSTDGSGGSNGGPSSAGTTRRVSNVSQRGMWQQERKSRPKERKSAAARFPFAGVPTSLGGEAFGGGLVNGMGQMEGNPAYQMSQQRQHQQEHTMGQQQQLQMQQRQQHRQGLGFDPNNQNNAGGELRASGVSGVSAASAVSGVSDLTVSFVSNGAGETSTFGGMTAALSFGGAGSVNNTQTSATFPNISLRSNEFMSLGEASFNALLEEEHDNGEIPSIDGVDGVVGGALAPPVERSSTSSATSSLAPSVATSSENRHGLKSSASSGGSRNNSRVIVAPDPSLLAAAASAGGTEGNQKGRRLSAGSIAGSIAGMSIDSKMSTESSWLRQYSTMQGVTDAAVWNDESGRSVMSDLSTDVLALDLADAATHMSRANA